MKRRSVERFGEGLRGILLSALRRPVRLLLPQSARAKMPYLRDCVRSFGLLKGAVTFHKIYNAKEGAVVRVSIPQSKTALALRADTSDVTAFKQIFIRKDYDIGLAARPRLIIDGGANVGYASVFFANKYPGAKIIAVEPEETNYEMLRENTRAYPNVTALRSGIWGARGRLAVENPGDEKWCFRVREAEGQDGSIEALRVEDLVELSGADFIDILKLDIEGAEREVFAEPPAWLERVGVIIIELHDHYKAGCSEAFYSAIAGHDFAESRRGENVVLVRNQSRPAAAAAGVYS